MHSLEQIVRKIQQADRFLAEGGDLGAALRELKIAEATYHRWRNHYDGLKADEAKKLKHLKEQNLAFQNRSLRRNLRKRTSESWLRETSKPHQ